METNNEVLDFDLSLQYDIQVGPFTFHTCICINHTTILVPHSPQHWKDIILKDTYCHLKNNLFSFSTIGEIEFKDFFLKTFTYKDFYINIIDSNPTCEDS